MKLIYSRHLKNRLVLRQIRYDLPSEIFENAEEKYFDNATGHYIAIRRAVIYDKERDVMVAYKTVEKTITLLTIHPLKSGQKKNRLRIGRWRKP